MSLATAMRLCLPLSFVKSTRQPTLPSCFQDSDIPAQMPLMYYPGRLLLESGADVFLVGYNYSQRPDFQSAPVEERDLWLRTDAIAAYQAALAQRNYERVTLVGKSIGTRAIGHLLATEERLPSLRCVWLTPILRNETVLRPDKTEATPSIICGWHGGFPL